MQKQVSLKSFAKSRSRMELPDHVRRNLIPDTCTADGEGVLPEVSLCPHDKSCVSRGGTQLAV